MIKKHFLLAILISSQWLINGCQVNVTASEDDEPLGGTTKVYELFVLQEDLDRTFNVLFVPDTSYGDLSVLANRQAFIDDTSRIIEQSFWQNQAYYFNFPHFNYFYLVETGSVTERSPDSNGVFRCPTVVWPSEVDTDGAFADVKLLIHGNQLRDCANPASGRATAEPNSFRTVAHETAHALFGLNDEYCCDSNYSHAPPVLYNTESACVTDVVNSPWRSCESFVSTRTGDDWWRSEGDISSSALMLSGGSTVWEFGPADWVTIEAAYRTLPGVSGTTGVGNPTVFAPDNWDRPPPP